MLHTDFTTLSHHLARWFSPQPRPSPSLALPLLRPNLAQLAAMGEAALPPLVRQSPTALRYLHLLGDLDWAHFPERPNNRAWPGPAPAPRAPYVAAYLVKIEEGKTYMSGLRTFLVEQPALVWLLGFPLVPDEQAPLRFRCRGQRSQPQATGSGPAHLAGRASSISTAQHRTVAGGRTGRCGRLRPGDLPRHQAYHRLGLRAVSRRSCIVS